jgi:hypothetical protein
MAITGAALELGNAEGEWRTGGRAGYPATWRNRVEWSDSQVSIFNSQWNNLSFAVWAFNGVSLRALDPRCALVTLRQAQAYHLRLSHFSLTVPMVIALRQ